MSGLQPARFINATMVDVNVEMDTVVFSNDTLKCTVRAIPNTRHPLLVRAVDMLLTQDAPPWGLSRFYP